MDQRDEQEFAEYFVARREAVRRTAFLLCGDWHRADDLAQTAFVALHRRWRKVRDKQALDAYVRRTLVRAVIDESRRPWRRERFVDEVPDMPSHVGEIGDAIFEQLHGGVVVEHVVGDLGRRHGESHGLVGPGDGVGAEVER